MMKPIKIIWYRQAKFCSSLHPSYIAYKFELIVVHFSSLYIYSDQHTINIPIPYSFVWIRFITNFPYTYCLLHWSACRRQIFGKHHFRLCIHHKPNRSVMISMGLHCRAISSTTHNTLKSGNICEVHSKCIVGCSPNCRNLITAWLINIKYQICQYCILLFFVQKNLFNLSILSI